MAFVSAKERRRIQIRNNHLGLIREKVAEVIAVNAYANFEFLKGIDDASDTEVWLMYLRCKSIHTRHILCIDVEPYTGARRINGKVMTRQDAESEYLRTTNGERVAQNFCENDYCPEKLIRYKAAFLQWCQDVRIFLI